VTDIDGLDEADQFCAAAPNGFSFCIIDIDGNTENEALYFNIKDSSKGIIADLYLPTMIHDLQKQRHKG
jgi:hypothetical protein